MTLHDKVLHELCAAIYIDNTHSEYSKFAKAGDLVNQAYFKIASKEFAYIKTSNPAKVIESDFDFLMGLYNKHIKEHQVMFLLFNIFETAIRSKAAIVLSEKYSSANQDDWLHNRSLVPTKIQHTLDKSKEIITLDSENILLMDTFQIFDYILLGGLKTLYISFWVDLSDLFEEKTFKGHDLKKIGKKAMTLMLESIRKSRNDNAHHKPFHSSRKRRHEIVDDMELILAHLGFNLEDAINNIDPQHRIIRLKYR
ncbi:MAG TPA: hypothetical protein PLM93_07170 [Sulfuricurvum sp.]|nr:MAG: hypothetical protein B7Y30_12090 [Campylobacterales bacterium 16-40-21]OZA02970.1 MAG: hypothetical protein B7X89_06465 [Sulfuricurvum sp. 17-40-25]HQS66948.1 hypothetical protein [Sulfuricurvum sp.]HQT36809.1 hypothetical protein [Sulfuricurvum sp.]